MRASLSTIVGDAWQLWRADWRILTALAAPFLFLPPLMINLLLSPTLDLAMSRIAPEDSAARFQIYTAWLQVSLPWMMIAQAVIQFGVLAVLTFYLNRGGATVGDALRGALRGLPIYLVTMILVSIVSFAGLFVLVIGYFYALARLSLAGTVIVAERESNPFAAIGRSVKLTRGSGWILTGVMLMIYGVTIVAQIPLEQIQQWMTVDAPNPVAQTMVGIVIAGISGAQFLAGALVQVAAYRRFTAGGPRFADVFR
jgi:magnesium-transporting ATPase (P-type)